MLFSVGTRVKFLHTADQGIVTAILSDDMVNVLLEGEDIEIPAFIEHLVRAEDYIDQNPSVKAKIVPGKKAKKIIPPERPPAESQYTILKSYGIQLAFDPILKKDATTEKYKIFLINDTRFPVIFNLHLSLKGKPFIKENGQINAISTFDLGFLWFDQLNDSPVINIECHQITTEGKGHALKKNLKIKPKQFFNRLTTAPLLNRQVHLFKIFENLRPKEKIKKEDLKTYTQRNTRPLNKRQTNAFYPLNDVSEFAEFIPELDLHIEKLSKKYRKLSKAEILYIQIKHFEDYINKAIRLGVERVFIIHGVGKGRLRDEIASQLLKIPEVKSFKNEFHPRYGYGATEVVF